MMNSKLKLMAHVGCVLSLAALTACNGGGGAPTGPTFVDANGNACGAAAPGCDFDSAGVLMTVSEDPNYTAGANEEVGYWTSPDGIIYYYGSPTNALPGERGRDSISNGAMAQKAMIADNARRLQAKYSLDANVSTNIAQAMTDWSTLGQSRKRTSADVAAFTKRLSGLDMNEVNNALDSLNKGDSSAYDVAISKAARNWSTSPDNMKRIMSDWFAQQGAKQ